MKLEFKVGNRYLINYNYPISKNIREVRVLEISKGKRIKLAIKRDDDTEYYDWDEIKNLNILEDLGIATTINLKLKIKEN